MQSAPDPLISHFVAAGGWVDTGLFGLKTFEAMGRGAVALKDIPADTPLFHVPARLLVSPFSSDLREQLSAVEWDSLGTGWSQLILVMMWEASKGESSQWSYYLCGSGRPSRF